MALSYGLVLGVEQIGRPRVLVLLLHLSDLIGYCLFLQAELAGYARLISLLPVIDHNAHICGRTLHDVLVGTSGTSDASSPVERLGFRCLVRRREEAHVKLGIGVYHLHLLSELGNVEALGSHDRRRGLHREYFGVTRPHHSQTHHVVCHIKLIMFRRSGDLQALAEPFVRVLIFPL